MARSLTSPKINFKLMGSLKNTLTDSSESSISQPAFSYSKGLTTGVNDNQVNRAWQSKGRALVNATQETINLRVFTGLDIGGGVGNDALGQAMDLQEIVAIVIQNDNAIDADGVLEIIPANSEGWSVIGSHTGDGGLYGQGCLIKTQAAEEGFPIADGSDRITLKATGGGVSYSIYVFGRSDSDESSSSSQSSSQSSSSSSISTSSSSISASSSSISTSTSSSSQSSSSSSSSQSESSSSLSSQS